MANIAGIPSTTKFSNIGGQVMVYLGNGANRKPTTAELQAYNSNPKAFDTYGMGNTLLSGPSKTVAPAPAPVAKPAAAPAPAPASTGMNALQVSAPRPATPTPVATPTPTPVTTVAAPAPRPATPTPVATPTPAPTAKPATTTAPATPTNPIYGSYNPYSTTVPTGYTTPASYATPMTVDIPRLNLGPFWFQNQATPFSWTMPTITPSQGMSAFNMPTFNWGAPQGPR